MEKDKNKNERYYSPASVVAIVIVSFFLSQVLGFLLFLFGLGLVSMFRSLFQYGLSGSIGDVFFSFKSAIKFYLELTSSGYQPKPLTTFLQIGCIEGVMLALLFWFIKRRRINLKSLGLNRAQLKHLGYAALGFGVYFLSYIVTLMIVKTSIPGLNLDQKQELGFNTTTNGNDLWYIFVSLVVLPPVVEEFVMRGFLFTSLRAKLSFIRSTVIVSILFAAAHLGEGGNGGLLWVAAIDTFILSVVLCYLREKTGSLWPSMGVHMIKNGVAFIVLFNVVQIAK